MTFKKLKAYATLGVEFAWHMVKLPFRQSGHGRRQFLKNYSADGIFPVTKEWQNKLPLFSNCLNCHLCDVVCPAPASEPQALPPSYLATTFSRSLTDHRLFSPANTSCQDCHKCAEACPHGVPLKEVIAFLVENSRNQNA